MAFKLSAPKPGQIRGALALTASLALHLFLLTSAGLDRKPSRGARANRPPRPLSIELIKPAAPAAVAAPGLADAATRAAEPQPERPAQARAGQQPAPEPAPALPDNPAPLLSLLPSAAPYYFLTSELTAKPQLELDVSPELANALRDEVPQAVTVRLLINERGGIDQVIVEQSALSVGGQRLLIDAFSKVKFVAGKIDQAAVKSEMKIEVMLERLLPQSVLLEQIAPKP